jgi:hypothetical protein
MNRTSHPADLDTDLDDAEIDNQDEENEPVQYRRRGPFAWIVRKINNSLEWHRAHRAVDPYPMFRNGPGRTAIAALVIALLASAVTIAPYLTTPGASTNATASANGAATRTVTIPGEFAAHCIELAVSAGEDNMAAWTNECNPQITKELMKGQEANRLRAIGAKAHPTGSYPVEGQPNVYSVLVSVQDMQEWREAGDSGGYGSIGPQWYRVAVYHDPETGEMSMLGKGYQVPGPTADQPPVIATDIKKADPNEPRTLSVQGFLSAWMPKPPKDKEGQGDVTPWVTDGLKVAAFHSPQIKSVKVTHTAFTELPVPPGATDARPRINADVMIEVGYRSGTTARQLVTLTLAPAGESGSRYVVDGLPGAPGTATEDTTKERETP